MRKARQSTFERLTFERLNRSQRRNLRRRLFSADPGLTVVHPNAGGIDVGNASHYAAVPPDRDECPVQEFGCWTADLKRLCEWFVKCKIDTVAMQATGVYWIPLYDLLEEHGVRVVLVNAQHTTNVPGRKTDVQECQWLMKLHAYGLLRDSFRLPEQMQKIRTLWRVRARHVQEAGRAIQHMQKALTKMNVQLANVISDISGVTGQAIIHAILGGERDPYRLADLRDRHVRASREEIARSLEGTWREDLLFELRQAVNSHEFAHRQMRECDKELQRYTATLPTRTIAVEAAAAIAHESSGQRVKKSPAKNRRKPKGNAPDWDLKLELQRITGVDLTAIDGIDVMTAFTFVAEIGPDLSAFPSEDQFAAWLGLTPNKRVTGGKVIGRERRKVRNRVAAALRMAASTLKDSKSWLGGYYRHKCRVLPAHASAVKATAHYLAQLIYRMLTKGQAWVDRGAERYQQHRNQVDMAILSKHALAKGFKLVPVQPEG
jgi:transposase